MRYEPNEEAQAIAEKMIPEIHPHLAHARIAYLHKVKPKPKKAKPPRLGRSMVLAKLSKVSPKMQTLIGNGYDFVFESDFWAWQQLNDKGRLALVDHELSHGGNDADGYYLKNHDVEEFGAIIERHGVWKSDLAIFLRQIPTEILEEIIRERSQS